jgi:uncharacterized damage-inducible protein DinB
MAKQIWDELADAKKGLLHALSLFNSDNFNVIPFEDSWTGGQVAEHVYKSIQGVPQLLTGASQPTERDPAMAVPQLRKMFLDFETKMQSPPFILPSNEPKDLISLTKQLDETLAAIIDAAQNVDLTLTIVGFEFPGSGPLTRLELVNFISVHAQRHTWQLYNIHRHF